MMRMLAIVLLALFFAPVVVANSAEAGGRYVKGKYAKRHMHRSSVHRRSVRRRYSRRPRVRGFVRRGGYYSYTGTDVVNTYGDSRTRYGGVNAYRDPFTDRQTLAGPFDHGWFFDSAVAPRGGDSPYMQ